SQIAEAFRTLRASLQYGPAARNFKTLLVTSAEPGEGKTTAASNLAIVSAQAGNRILLIDGDFHRSELHRVFKLPNCAGLANVLCGKIDLESAIQPTSIANLHLICAGPVATNPSDVLNTQALTEALSRMAANYDLVIVDSPPVNPVADAHILS